MAETVSTERDESDLGEKANAFELKPRRVSRINVMAIFKVARRGSARCRQYLPILYRKNSVCNLLWEHICGLCASLLPFRY